MSSFLKKKPVIAASAGTAAILTVVMISHFIGFNPVTNIVHSVLSPFRSGITYIAGKVSGTVEFIWEMDSYKRENEKLMSEVTSLKRENRDVAQYREENERLKELLELKNSMKDYSTVTASVIGYSGNNGYDKIEISKGTASGIGVGNTVISGDGVVGMVTETGLNWAVVTTILEKNNAMGVKITRTGDIAVLEGDEELSKQGYCKMTFINSSVNIIAGDLIETSGSAAIYPTGLLVGKIKDINSDNMGQINYATIEPSVDLKNLHEVLVINGID